MPYEPIVRHVTSLYAGNIEVDFSEVLAGQGEIDDADMAELIEQDGRMRLARQLPTTMERYLAAVPDLLQRRDPLDAAIDVNLRWIAGGPRADESTVEALIAQYPSLEEEIRDAAALGNALWSTAGLRKHVTGGSKRELPQEFGPPMADGSCRYLLQELIGAGAFGEVYKAVDRQLSEEGHPALVALKVLNDRSDTQGTNAGHRLLGRPRLLEEATKARRVNHPNVVRVLDRGVTDDDSAYIVYDFIDGGDLDRWIAGRQSTVPVREAATMIAQIARGVQAAHSAGLVHCDLKPGNIILTRDGEPKVADFGIAVRFGQSRPGEYDVEALDANHPIGNVAFISPEQYRMDDGALTVPSDVYALGGMLFTLLTGRLPNGSSLKEIARTHDRKKGRTAPPPVRSLRPDVDRDLEAICQRAMALAPEDRYSAAGALADDLEAWLRLEPLYWTKPSAIHVINLWRRRKPAVAVSWALLFISVVAGAFAVTHYSRQAAAAEVDRARAQMEAEIAQIKEAETAAREEHFVSRVNDFRRQLTEAAIANRTTFEIFSSLWTLENIFSPTVVASRGAIDELHSIRFNAVQVAVAEAVRDGRENDLDALLWRSMLAFWMVGAGDIDQALPMLEELDVQWQKLLHPSDRWLGYLQAIRACAVVKLLDERSNREPLSDDEINKLRVSAATLAAQEEVVRLHDPRSPIHHLIIDCLTRVYRPHMLNDPQRLKQAEAIPGEVGIRRDFRPRR